MDNSIIFVEKYVVNISNLKAYPINKMPNTSTLLF